MTEPDSRPHVVLVGGPDIDARVGLMSRLRARYRLTAVGSGEEARGPVEAAGFAYRSYGLSRGMDPLGDLAAVLRLRRLFRELDPALVHTFDTKPGLWARFGARLARVPVVVGTLPGLGSLYAREDRRTRMVRAVYQRLQGAACRASDMTVFQNPDDRDRFVAEGVAPAERSTVILSSGIDTDEYRPGRVPDAERRRLREELGLSADRPVVLMVSRVIRTKGVLEFAEAAERLLAEGSDARFVLVGPDDDASPDRLRPPERARLEGAVRWLGPRRDVRALLAISDVFALPSRYAEGVPRVLLEAAAMELPLVTTSMPGCREVVEAGVNGAMVEPGDADGLADAVRELVADPELRRRMGRASRVRVHDRFALDVVARATDSLYRELLSRGRPDIASSHDAGGRTTP